MYITLKRLDQLSRLSYSLIHEDKQTLSPSRNTNTDTRRLGADVRLRPWVVQREEGLTA